MADDAVNLSVKARCSEAEWKARVDLAALYRLVALHGWDDLIFTHISMRVPGPEHHFLINPYGLMFDEITASSLVKVDLDGGIVEPTPYYINPAGFTIHSAIHAAREDATCVIHLHSDAGVAVSAMDGGLQPLTQHALIALPQVAYHDYEGIALNLDERERIVADLGQTKRLMILKNHGTLAVGSSASEAFLGIYFLEKACIQQVMAMSGGADGVLLAPQAAQDEVRSQVSGNMAVISQLTWPGLIRKLDRALPEYDA
jgi:ribulose-5-phosphate 4-epimerase/fuculose-1-phosphate aldolase